MQNYKIRTRSSEESVAVQSKAFELGYRWHSGSLRVETWCTQVGIYIDSDGRMLRSTTEEHFNAQQHPEISYQDFLRLGEQPIINNTTEIMSEITLKCIQEPQKAKNITVDRDYTGILTDSEDTQVDTLGEAKFFRCVNNNGVEAKYRLSLFAPITPPPPPEPPKITQQEFIDGLQILANRVSITYNGNLLRVLDFGYRNLSDDGTTCSCGIHSSNGLDDLWDQIEDHGIQNTSIISNYDFEELIDEVFKAIVIARVQNSNVGLMLFSTVEDSQVCESMDWLADHNDTGYKTETHLNPNSGNQIKAWLIPKQ